MPNIDTSTVSTPGGMRPAVKLSGIAGIPSIGTGLYGKIYAPGLPIYSISKLQEIMFSQPADLRFTASAPDYRGAADTASVAEFLGADAASVTGGDPNALVMDAVGISLSGYVYIPKGVHQINVRSDDGFKLKIGGVNFSSHEYSRGPGDTARTAQFDGGLYKIDLIYFDNSGGQMLGLEIDGLIADQSAFYRTRADFLSNAGGGKLISKTQYHPSNFLGKEVFDGPDSLDGASGYDHLDGDGGNDVVMGRNGGDSLEGGYGNDRLMGGNDDDVLDGGRGSDLLQGGDGDDLLISRSDAGEQRIGQLAIGRPTRGDPDREVKPGRQKLKGWESQPKIGDDVLVGGKGRDTFLIAPQINAKLDIIKKHIRHDGTIDWRGVAGENNELHDHWVDSFGIDVIADYDAREDQIAIIGHTVSIGDISYRDIDRDGDLESIITVLSDQGAGGGAHTDDLIGQLIVYGDRVEASDIRLDAGVMYGIVDTYRDLAEALYPRGQLKKTVIDGKIQFGYDSRDAGGGWGKLTARPEKYIDNPFIKGVSFADPSPKYRELTRGQYTPMRERAVAGETVDGSSGDDTITPSAGHQSHASGLPGAIGYWRLGQAQGGSFFDAKGGAPVMAYRLDENRALIRTDGLTDGPQGAANDALHFNGVDEFAFLRHEARQEIAYGTIALWIKPENLRKFSIILSKDESGDGDGGHFRLGHTDKGGLFLRFAQGDGGGNNAWKTAGHLLKEGQWQHVAVSFTDHGVKVFLDGKAISDYYWTPVEGAVANPGRFKEDYLTQNQEPWVIGADSSAAQLNDSAGQFATDDGSLRNVFEGSVSDLGIWGGMDPEDALKAAQVRDLYANGPGMALNRPADKQLIFAGDDLFHGRVGNDEIFGEGGNDRLFGDLGDDTLYGGYGQDRLFGGADNDTLDGGRGDDLLDGGDGDDVLISRSDAGEQRAGQLVTGNPTRPFPDPSISAQYLKLIDWVSHPIKGDDVLVGGKGRDLFYFQPEINAKRDIILKHTNADRSIDWRGVAGENNRIHDHWVDLIGVDVIADYNAAEDTIAIVGHTANIDINYRLLDTDRDGKNDSAVSVITIYSDQGANGGAHTQDIIGYVVVHGDLVDKDSVLTNAGSFFGVVDTIDDLRESQAPTGSRKVSVTPQGEMFIGYDTRDKAGDPMGRNPEKYATNPFANLVKYADPLPNGATRPKVLVDRDAGNFNGTSRAVEIPHRASMELNEGTYAFNFIADAPGNGHYQALISKDHSGYKTGGHLTIWIDHSGHLLARFQGIDSETYLYDRDTTIEAGRKYNLAFTFDDKSIKLYLDGVLIEEGRGFAGGMTGNQEDLVVGASSASRYGSIDNYRDFFDGKIDDVLVLDRALYPLEALLLARGGGRPWAIMEAYNTGSGGNSAQNGLAPADALGADPLAGDDDIRGNAGDNILVGRDGNDSFDGGAGTDIYKGGAGNDVFRFDELADSSAQLWEADRIQDFVSGEDMIDITGIDADPATAGDQAFALVSQFSGAAGEAVISRLGPNRHLLRLDQDGDGVSDFVLDIRGDAPLAGDLLL